MFSSAVVLFSLHFVGLGWANDHWLSFSGATLYRMWFIFVRPFNLVTTFWYSDTNLVVVGGFKFNYELISLDNGTRYCIGCDTLDVKNMNMGV